MFFTVSSYSFGVNAAGLGIDSPPTNVSFDFVSAVGALGAQFDATLESRDGTVTAAFPQVSTFEGGQFQGTYYSGSVAVLDRSMNLSSAISEQIFAGSAAVLELTDIGPGVTLGLPPYTLAEDLTLCMSAQGFSDGGPTVAVRMDDDPSGAPEPDSRLLLALGASLLVVAKRFRRAFGKCVFANRWGSLVLSSWQIGILPLKCLNSNQRSQKITE